MLYFGTGKICGDPKTQVLPTQQHGMPWLCKLDPLCTVDVHPIAMLQQSDLQYKPSANNILDHQALRNIKFNKLF